MLQPLQRESIFIGQPDPRQRAQGSVGMIALITYDTNVNKAVKLPAGMVYRRCSAEHAHVSVVFMLGIVSVVRAFHSLVLHKCTASVLDIFTVLVY
jgi:hypothetical protein